MRYVAYVRVSTDEQARSGLSLEAQRDRLVNWCGIFDHTLIEVVSDEGFSAKSTARPGLERILEMIERREIDGIVFWKLDRLTRSTRDLADILDLCKRKRVDLASVSESLDTSTACGRMVVSMIGVVAQWEREAIGERTSDALQVKRARGERFSGIIPFGYRLTDGRLVAAADEQAALDAVKQMTASAWHSLRALSRMLDERGMRNRSGKPFSASSVRRMVATVGKVVA